MEEEAVLVHRHGFLCAPASVSATRRTSSADRASAERGSWPAIPCGGPSSSHVCPVRPLRCHRATPASVSMCRHQSPSPGSPDPASGSAAWSGSRPDSLSFHPVHHAADQPAPEAVAPQDPEPLPAVRSTQSPLSPKQLLAVQTYETSLSSSDSHSPHIISPESSSPVIKLSVQTHLFRKGLRARKKSSESLYPPLDLKTVGIAMCRCICLHHLQKRKRRMRQAGLPPVYQAQLALHLQLRHLHSYQHAAL